MAIVEAREDLVRGLLQSVYVIESARAGVQRKWGGDFTSDAERTTKRAERLGRLLDERGIRRPDEVIGPHTDWFESLCGSHPHEVPLGSAILHNFGKWGDVMCEPFLDDITEFIELGLEHARVDLAFVPWEEDQFYLPQTELPPGRRFVVLTDIHIGSRGRSELARAAVKDINELGADFVVIPGDFTEDGEPEQFAEARAIFDELTCPYYAVLGNHDAVQRSTREPIGEQLYERTFGIPSQDFVVECGELQVALMNSTDPTASPFPDWDMATGKVGGDAAGVDSGALRPGQAEALASRLDPKRPTLLVQHHELHPFPGFPPVKFALREDDAYAELDALKDHRLIGVVAGHTHRSAVLKVGRDASVTQLEVPALKDYPHAFSVCVAGDDGVQVIVRQPSDRELLWQFSRFEPPLIRRFAIGPLADLSYTFTL